MTKVVDIAKGVILGLDEIKKVEKDIEENRKMHTNLYAIEADLKMLQDGLLSSELESAQTLATKGLTGSSFLTLESNRCRKLSTYL